MFRQYDEVYLSCGKAIPLQGKYVPAYAQMPTATLQAKKIEYVKKILNLDLELWRRQEPWWMPLTLDRGEGFVGGGYV